MEPVIFGPSGRPVLTEHEVEVNTCSEVSVEGPGGMNGVYLVRLTNFRFVFQDTRSSSTPTSGSPLAAQSPPHRMLHWSHIARTSVGKSFFLWRSTTLTLHLFTSSNDANTPDIVTLNLLPEQFDKFVKDVQLQQDRKSWLHYPLEYLIMTGKEVTEDAQNEERRKAISSAPRTNSTTMVGIAGLTKHMEDKHKEVGNSLQEAFKDMDSLFEKAREMVSIANRLSSASRPSSSGASEEESHFQADMMHMMGIRSPVTLGTHDNHDLYLEELAREVDTFVCANFHLLKARAQRATKPTSGVNASPSSAFPSSASPSTSSQSPLSATNTETKINIASDVLPLTDLYCIFNRARGSSLVSPNDLYQACARLSPLKLRCRLIELNDRVLAVASSEYNETHIARQVAHLLQSMGPLSAAQLSSNQHIGLPLATHYLLRAEAMELACRDHSTEGLIFWPNIFATPSQLHSPKS